MLHYSSKWSDFFCHWLYKFTSTTSRLQSCFVDIHHRASLYDSIQGTLPFHFPITFFFFFIIGCTAHFLNIPRTIKVNNFILSTKFIFHNLFLYIVNKLVVSTECNIMNKLIQYYITKLKHKDFRVYLGLVFITLFSIFSAVHKRSLQNCNIGASHNYQMSFACL